MRPDAAGVAGADNARADAIQEATVTPRPSTVTAARSLLGLVAVLPLLSALLGLLVLDELRRASIAAYGGMRGGRGAARPAGVQRVLPRSLPPAQPPQS